MRKLTQFLAAGDYRGARTLVDSYAHKQNNADKTKAIMAHLLAHPTDTQAMLYLLDHIGDQEIDHSIVNCIAQNTTDSRVLLQIVDHIGSEKIDGETLLLVTNNPNVSEQVLLRLLDQSDNYRIISQITINKAKHSPEICLRILDKIKTHQGNWKIMNYIARNTTDSKVLLKILENVDYIDDLKIATGVLRIIVASQAINVAAIWVGIISRIPRANITADLCDSINARLMQLPDADKQIAKVLLGSKALLRETIMNIDANNLSPPQMQLVHQLKTICEAVMITLAVKEKTQAGQALVGRLQIQPQINRKKLVQDLNLAKKATIETKVPVEAFAGKNQLL